MAYGDNTYGADHRWALAWDFLDSVGTLDGASTTVTFTAGVIISRDTTSSAFFNTRDDDIAIPNSTTFSGQTSRLIGGWFRVSQIQGPPCLIYKEGSETAGISLYLWAGNNVMMEVRDTVNGTDLQIYSDRVLAPNRDYHIMVSVEHTDGAGLARLYIDGVEQTNSFPGDEITSSSFSTHTGNITLGESTTPRPGGESVIVKAAVNSYYSNWWSWSGLNARKTETQIRQLIVEPGAVPETVITSGTQATMQAQLDTLANSVRGNSILSILVEPVTGDGDLNLTADNIVFSELVSIDVRYEGAGTLRWTNTNGSNASRVSGNMQLLNPFQLTLTGVEDNTEIRVYEAGTTTEVAGIENTTGGQFSATVSSPLVDIVIASLNFRIQTLKNIAITSDVSIPVTQFFDRNYLNPA